MISAGEFRNGVTFDMDGKVMQVVEFQHVKPGKGAAFVRVKMKNVITGAVTETSFNPTAKFPTAFVERKKMEYSYNDGALYYFMDQETYELEPIDASALDDSFKFVKENDVCTIMSYKGKVFGVEVPNFADLVVTKTEPGFAGNTATNVTKPATRVTRSRSTPAPASLWAAPRLKSIKAGGRFSPPLFQLRVKENHYDDFRKVRLPQGPDGGHEPEH